MLITDRKATKHAFALMVSCVTASAMVLCATNSDFNHNNIQHWDRITKLGRLKTVNKCFDLTS